MTLYCSRYVECKYHDTGSCAASNNYKPGADETRLNVGECIESHLDDDFPGGKLEVKEE